MSDPLIFRTEDIKDEDIIQYFVESEQDRRIIDSLKSKAPTIVVGSRGVGKSFLLKVAIQELSANFANNKVLPIYISFVKGTLIQTNDQMQFQHWMLGKLWQSIIRSMRRYGFTDSSAFSLTPSPSIRYSKDEVDIAKIVQAYEQSWEHPDVKVDIAKLPSVDQFKEAVEDICIGFGISRFCVFFDEAAHILKPEQQRQFFTLFRDLRSPFMTCNAAVYPGVTNYGDTFEPTHDATFLNVNRDVLSEDYIKNMEEMIVKQGDLQLIKQIEENREHFSELAYASDGNPRLLFKTILRAKKLNGDNVRRVIREYYRDDIWSEHSMLVESYTGHKPLIDWGRNFVEGNVLNELYQKNEAYLKSDKKTSCFIWLHRDAPEAVRHAFRLLSYTGIIREHATGIKATRAEIGSRYAVHLGIVMSKVMDIKGIRLIEFAKNLSIKLMTEYGMNHESFKSLPPEKELYPDINVTDILKSAYSKSIELLDVTEWQKVKLKELNLLTLEQVLRASDEKLQKVKYVGPHRSRAIKNSVREAVYEYLSG